MHVMQPQIMTIVFNEEASHTEAIILGHLSPCKGWIVEYNLHFTFFAEFSSIPVDSKKRYVAFSSAPSYPIQFG